MKASRFVSEYLKPDTIKTTGPRRVLIKDLVEVTFEGRDGRPTERKVALVVDDEGDELKVVMNKQNLRTLIEAFRSDDSGVWTGRVIELYFDPNVTFGGKRTGGLRVRPIADDALFAVDDWEPALAKEPEART